MSIKELKKSKLNVLVVTSFFFPDTYGGSNRVVYEISKRLAAKGHNVYVITRRINSSFSKHENVNGIYVYRYNAPGWRWVIRNVFTVINIVRVFRKLSCSIPFDIIHYHDVFSSFGINLATIGKKIPKMATNHSPAYLEVKVENPNISGGFFLSRYTHNILLTIYSWTIKIIEKWNFSKAKKIIVLSRFSKQQLTDLYGVREEKIKIISGGVDLAKFFPKFNRSEARKILGLPLNRPLLLTVRRLEHRMGLENLIRAVSKIKKKIPDILLIIGGKGSLENELKKKVSLLGIEDIVRFEGFIDENRLSSYYQAVDLYVSPTQALEGFGLSIVEALAAGTPVIGTPVGAIPEILKKIDKRFLFEGTHSDSIAKGIINVLTNQKEIDDFRSLCVKYAKNNFNWDNATIEVEKLLRVI